MTEYVSNTLASTASQKIFISEKPVKYTSRVFYKIFAEGEFEYVFTYGDSIDGTFADGSESYANLACGDWRILSISVAVTENETAESMDSAERIRLTFEGEFSKEVSPCEVFSTDPVLLKLTGDQYICIETEFEGRRFPHHPEVQIPVYVKEDKSFERSVVSPLPNKIACKRAVEKKVLFWGDSITQGIGVPENSYLHYAALTAEIIGRSHSYYNIGIGYGRARDAASLGSWAERARGHDVASVCFGVNDVKLNESADEIKGYLKTILEFLHQCGPKVLVQTVPPFNYSEEYIGVWNEVNSYIRDELSKEADAFLDAAKLLWQSESEPHVAKYGGHPTEGGTRIWAEALAPVLEKLLK